MSIPTKTFMFILLALSVVFISAGAASAADSIHTVANVKSNTHINTTTAETIQEMIDQAKPGSTISIVKGAYNENLYINKNITLKGAGASNTIINCRHRGSVITIKRKQTVKLIGLTIINGKATDGGGIRNIGGTLIVENSIIKGNTANNGGGIENTNYGTCTVTNSIITNNTAEYDGGGIFNEGGTCTLTWSIIEHNFAYKGGGIYNTNKQIENLRNGVLSLHNSIITLNTAKNDGGGIFNNGIGEKDGKTQIKENNPDNVEGNTIKLNII